MFYAQGLKSSSKNTIIRVIALLLSIVSIGFIIYRYYLTSQIIKYQRNLLDQRGKQESFNF